MSGLYYSPELCPHVLDDGVRSLGAPVIDELLRRELVRYLSGTLHLELMVVNRVAEWLMHGAGAGVYVHASARRAAARLRDDEVEHAAGAARLLSNIGANAALCGPPSFSRALDTLLDDVAPQERDLVRFLFVVVTETMVTDRLRHLGSDDRIRQDIRLFVAVHAADEVWHSAYFSARLAEVWPQLPTEQRGRLGALVPRLIELYTEPDVDAIDAEMVDVGVASEHRRSALRATVHPPRLLADRRRACSTTVRALRGAGALNEPQVRRAFVTAGLLTGEG